MTLWIGDVNGDLLMKEKNKEEGIAINCCKVEDVVALTINQKRVGPSMKQQVHDIVMALLSSPHSRRCARLSTFGIDICAGLDEELACCILVVDGGPLLRIIR